MRQTRKIERKQRMKNDANKEIEETEKEERRITKKRCCCKKHVVREAKESLSSETCVQLRVTDPVIVLLASVTRPDSGRVYRCSFDCVSWSVVFKLSSFTRDFLMNFLHHLDRLCAWFCRNFSSILRFLCIFVKLLYSDF